jgi:hypothetical protein
MTTRFKLLSLSASLLACGMIVSTGAQANAYAVASTNIKNGLVIGLFNGQSIGAGIPGIFTFGTPESASNTSATLNGIGQSFQDTVSPPDASPSNGTGSNPVRTNENVTAEYYNLFGQLGTAYSSSDAIINSEQDETGTPIVARNMAESNIPVTGFAGANSDNTSSTTLTLGIKASEDCATNDCRISFSFLADPYIYAILDALADPGSVARGRLTYTITLANTEDNSLVFSWNPNGAIGAQGTCLAGQGSVFGGCETADGVSLNLNREVLVAGTSAEHSGPYGAGTYGSFGAFTNALAPGDYTLTLSGVSLTDVKRVPEPATLALLGLGLAGLGYARRRKQA